MLALALQLLAPHQHQHPPVRALLPLLLLLLLPPPRQQQQPMAAAARGAAAVVAAALLLAVCWAVQTVPERDLASAGASGPSFSGRHPLGSSRHDLQNTASSINLAGSCVALLTALQ